MIKKLLELSQGKISIEPFFKSEIFDWNNKEQVMESLCFVTFVNQLNCAYVYMGVITVHTFFVLINMS